MQVFIKFLTFLCILSLGESMDFNFWLGVPTNVTLNSQVQSSRNYQPVQLYTCMANLLCQLGMEAVNIIRVCDNLVAPDEETLEEGKTVLQPIWQNFGGNFGGNIGGNIGAGAGGSIGSNGASVGGSFGGVSGGININWNRMSTVSPEVSEKESKMFEEARKELCEMDLNSQYVYIHDKYFEASTMYERAENRTAFNAEYPSFNCTLTMTFDLPAEGKCGERYIYQSRPSS